MVRHLLAAALLTALLASDAMGAPRWRISDWGADGRLDYRIVHMSTPDMSTRRGLLMAAEVEIAATVSNADRDLLDIALQWPYVTDMEGVDERGKEMHFGNAYAVYKFGLGRPNLRFGQFVAPFGNLTYYETHSRPLQSLYPENLGIRIDRGVSLEGFKGEYDYWLAVMGGNGARSDNNGSLIVIGRLARRLDLPAGVLTTGVSVLYGTDMPRFSLLVDPLMGHAAAHPGGDHLPALDFTDKLRVGLDAEYSAGRDLWRAEVVTGRDSDGGAHGQFLQWNRMVGEHEQLSLQVARWQQPAGVRLRVGALLAHELHDYSTVRVALERSTGRASHAKQSETMVNLQFVRMFPQLLGR